MHSYAVTDGSCLAGQSTSQRAAARHTVDPTLPGLAIAALTGFGLIALRRLRKGRQRLRETEGALLVSAPASGQRTPSARVLLAERLQDVARTLQTAQQDHRVTLQQLEAAEQKLLLCRKEIETLKYAQRCILPVVHQGCSHEASTCTNAGVRWAPPTRRLRS